MMITRCARLLLPLNEYEQSKTGLPQVHTYSHYTMQWNELTKTYISFIKMYLILTQSNLPANEYTKRNTNSTDMYTKHADWYL